MREKYGITQGEGTENRHDRATEGQDFAACWTSDEVLLSRGEWKRPGRFPYELRTLLHGLSAQDKICLFVRAVSTYL